MKRRCRFIMLFAKIVFRRFHFGVILWPRIAYDVCAIVHGKAAYKDFDNLINAIADIPEVHHEL